MPMVKMHSTIGSKIPFILHFAGMPMVGGRGQKSKKIADVLNGWSLRCIVVELAGPTLAHSLKTTFRGSNQQIFQMDI